VANSKKKKAGAKVTTEEKEYLLKVGLAIKGRRIELGFESAEDFASEHDLSRTWYGDVERGKSDIRSLSLYRVWKALDIDPREFYIRLDELAKKGKAAPKN
jgi:hypothetical protein